MERSNSCMGRSDFWWGRNDLGAKWPWGEMTVICLYINKLWENRQIICPDEISWSFFLTGELHVPSVDTACTNVHVFDDLSVFSVFMHRWIFLILKLTEFLLCWWTIFSINSTSCLGQHLRKVLPDLYILKLRKIFSTYTTRSHSLLLA